MIKFFLVAALVPAMAMADVNFRACPNGAPTPATLTVNNCAGNQCILADGQPLNGLASGIVSPVGSNYATAHILARVSGFKIPVSGNGEVVGGYQVVAGIPFDYALNINALKFPLHGIPGEVEVNLTGDEGDTLACLRFDANIP